MAAGGGGRRSSSGGGGFAFDWGSLLGGGGNGNGNGGGGDGHSSLHALHAIPLSKTLSHSETHLDRTVSLWSGIALIVGVSIGSGIFASPGPVYERAGSVGSAIAVWGAAGGLAIAGGLCYAELGTMMPASGGEHPYLLRAFGELPAFLFSWTGITATRPGSLAIITVICAEYVMRLVYFEHPASAVPPWQVKAVAATIIALLTLINVASSRASTAVQDVFTVLKLMSLAWMTVIGLVYLARDPPVAHNFDKPLFAGSSMYAGNYAIALFSALWAYDGWNNLNMVTGELKDPAKNLPRAIIGGPLIVMLCYIATNIAYFAVLPGPTVASSTTLGMDFGKQVFGHIGGIIIPLIVIGSTFGAANATLFTGSRVIHVSAQQGHAPRFLAEIHSTTHTPLNAIVVQSLLALVFVAMGNFASLVTFYSIIAWSFYLGAVMALLTLRVTHPYEERPFTVWLPLPLLFSLVTVCLITFSVWEAPREAAGAFAFLFAGVPVYWPATTGHLSIVWRSASWSVAWWWWQNNATCPRRRRGWTQRRLNSQPDD
ncbi:amino acid permease-domain-containing protein [Entophlyctis helioformis]|nr:amino acid permease-domain-containing protein [Entophlyctis helioformis]